MHPTKVRELAFQLRRQGYSYSHIARVTGLSKSTLSDWLTLIPYTPNKETVAQVGKAIAAANAKKTKLKQDSIKQLRTNAVRDIGGLSKRDLFMFGLGLYLGEGSKTHDIVRVVNSDPKVIQLAQAWFHALGVMNSQFRITLHLYPDSTIRECIAFWSHVTSIPPEQFGKVQVDLRTNKRKNKAGKLPFGTAQISIRSLGKKDFGVILARKIHAWTEEVSCLVNKRVWSTGMTRPFQG